jgi:transmembrane sensor
MSKRARAFSRIEVEASEWLVALSDRAVSAEQRARLEAWLNADPEHKRVFQVQQSVWSAVAQMPVLSTPSSRPKASPGKIFALAAALTLVALGALFRDRIPLLKPGTDYETRVAEVSNLELADGTRVTLGPSSHLDVAFEKAARRVALTRGEAFFDVAHDAARPFFVTAGTTLVRVVGTRFDVHYGSQDVRVAVAEGRVEVMRTGDSEPLTPRRKQPNIQILEAGQAALADRSGQIAATETIKEEDLGAWRSGRLVYVDAHLRDVVADINRYYNGKIELADEATGNMQLTAAFRVDQIDRMLEVLQNALPVAAAQASDGRIIIGEKPPLTRPPEK